MKSNTAGVAGRTKHLDINFKFVRERSHRDELEITYVPTTEQLADMFTKPLSTAIFKGHRANIGMISAKAFEDE